MHIKSSDFRVPEGAKVNLRQWPTRVGPVYGTDEEYQDLLRKHVKALSAQQELLYASDRYAILLIFQAMDAAGKDGAIQHVMSGVNPQGCQVYSFKHPSPIELQHDFLWRTTRDLPERGRIGIFNRSYYEEVLVVRVHPELLASEAVPDAPHDDKAVWRHRYRSILNLESHLHANGKRIVAVLNIGSGRCNADPATQARAAFDQAGLSDAKVVSVEPADLDKALDDAVANADVLVVLGGDGTISAAAARCGASGALLIP